MEIPSAAGDQPAEPPPSDSEEPGTGGIKFKDWGFKVDRLFEVAYRFYKRNESKAFHPTFDERNQMNALILQARYGNYDSDKAPDVGLLDMVGKNRQHQWSLLKGLSRMEAMSKFVCTLDEICPLFKAYAEAVKLSSNQQAAAAAAASANGTNGGTLIGRDRSDSQKMRDQLQSETEDQLAIVRKSLSRQTYSQFKSYAEKQHPNDTAKQRQLIESLQEQYYQQYISQMYPANAVPSPAANSTNAANGTQQTSNLIPQEQSPPEPVAEPIDRVQLPPVTSTSQSISQPNPPAVNNQPYTIDLTYELANLALQANSNILTSPQQEQALPPQDSAQEEPVISFVAEPNYAELMGTHSDSSCSTLSEESSNQRSFACEALEPASIWTKKSVKEFKDSLIGDPLAGEYLLKQGKLVTIQVPTYPNGKYIYWEFMTEDYDIGFGLDFAYEEPRQPQEQLELKIFEQTDDEDDEDEEDLIESAETVRAVETRDATQAAQEPRNPDKPPKVENTIAIIPTYRRNSHEEVFIGRHRYPGHGYYLLRFDNTYSVLRSKALHFRICYFI